MWCSVFGAVILPLGFCFGASYGIVGEGVGVGVGVGVGNSVSGWQRTSIWIALVVTETSFNSWLKAIAPAAAASFRMSTAVLATRHWLPASLPAAIEFGTAIAAGALAYAALVAVLFRKRDLAILKVVGDSRQ